MMAKLKKEKHSNQQEQQLKRPCPIIARIPDCDEWILLAYGLDVEAWFKQDLIDATMLSPFPSCDQDRKIYPEKHISLAHKYNKLCYGGIGSRRIQEIPLFENTGFYDPQPVYELAHRQYKAGADAMSIYQTDTLPRMSYLTDMLKNIGNRSLVEKLAKTLPDPGFPEGYQIGMDWHSPSKYDINML